MINDAGQVVIQNRGTYSAIDTYDFLDYVIYRGNIFISKKNNNIGHKPTGNYADKYWEIMIQLPGHLISNYIDESSIIINQSGQLAVNPAYFSED